ncbi:hypothetical protein [Candidatus Pelagibacter sp.]|uniref:hypothetical protein n=1 Tax=Candidatus Pelagibacter sp. TaxID=2024849 RepID=UPI003F836DAF
MKIYDYIIHLPNKIFYPFLFKDKKIFQNFQKKGYYFQDNYNNIKLSRFVKKHVDFKKVNELIRFKKNKNKKTYSVDITKILDKKVRIRLNKFFNNSNKINLTSSMLGYKTKLRNISVIINFFNEITKQNEGPKMFHRDSDSLQDQIKIFMLANDISDKCGMFYFVPNNYLSENSKLSYEKDRANMSLSNKWRNKDSTIKKFLNIGGKYNNKIKKFKGTQGETLFIDTGKVYHKGGYVSEKNCYRILIQAVYTPILSLSNWNTNRSKILTYIQHKLTTLRIKLRKTL